jgi:flagellar hook-associated protein 1 FlgK
MTNMLAFQRGYEGAARFMTAVDQMLDTLINRTGLVGR